MSRKRGQRPVVEVDVEEVEPEREVGSVVDEAVVPFEVRKDGSIAYFTQEKAALLREVGS